MTEDVSLCDGKMHVRIIGTGTPTLFLHGISAHGESWLKVAQALEASRSNLACWIPDLLGRGKSDPGTDLRYRLGDEVRRIQNFSEEFSANSPNTHFPSVIIGHSHGAAIALALAAVEPSVRGLILSNPITPQVHRPPILKTMEIRIVRHLIAQIIARFHKPMGHLILRRAGGPHFKVPRDSAVAYSQPYSEIGRARSLLRILSDWHPGDISAQLPKRKITTHIFAGAHDSRVPIDVATQFASELNAGLTIVEEGGHVLPEQEPNLLARKIDEIATMANHSF